MSSTTETDWSALWRELVERAAAFDPGYRASEGVDDAWADRAEAYLERVRKRWRKPDSTRTTVLAQIEPEHTVIDIGAGAGMWTALMARRARRVTAVEPSAAMRGVMRRLLEEEGIDNVDIVDGAWPDAHVPVHDHSLCSHAMYGYPDLGHFVERMGEVSRRSAMLLMRMPVPDGVMVEATRLVHGHPHDSPNAQVALPLLWRRGIFADLRMEDSGAWGSWTHPSLDEALLDCKRRLGIAAATEHDEALAALLERRLVQDGACYRWPPSVRSALLIWEVGTEPRN